MKKHLLTEFLIAYLLIGILGFFSVTVVASILIEDYLEGIIARNLNLEVSSIVANEHLQKSFCSGKWLLLEHDLAAIANYENSTIWFMNPDCEISISVPDNDFLPLPEQFHPENWKNGSHSIGNFYGCFPEPRLTVLAPMIVNHQTVGYVLIHYRMEQLYVRRSGALSITQIVFVLMYLLSSFLVALFYLRIYQPLQQITRGANEYAEGNLSYRIPVKSNNEMGYLANTLNYMSDILNQNGEFQKQFVSNVSHDFRSPLTSIKGYVNAILDGTIPPEFQDRYLSIIASETERLEKLTQSLLSLNELDTKKRTLINSRFDINQMIRSSAALFEGTCSEKYIRLELSLSEKELMVIADEQQIQQVLYNLIDNAIKFSPEHSSIRIQTARKGLRVFVSVKDYGCGIPKESLSKIWNRFYKTDSSRGKDRRGTGLGLSIVKEIINAHDQQIDVVSTVGEGTEFIFTLEKA